jgi:hypothetical protein
LEVMMSAAVSYDLIGDIHGQAGKLEALLGKLGYSRHGASWRPPEGHQAVFVGDLIDRGPEQVRVVNIVRSMVDAGNALAIMGNHEFNAIGFALPDPERPGQHLRPHSPKNRLQHAEFLSQVVEGSALHRDLVNWFRVLPPALDLGAIRVVHAWWHQPYVDLVNERLAGQVMSDEFVAAACRKGSPEWEAMEGLSKGLELRLPDGHSFVDHAGIERFDVRARWWMDQPRDFREVAIVGDQSHRVPEHPLPHDYPGRPVDDVPVFIGHYWMQGVPSLMAPKVACLDWSAAKSGPLVAYRWQGEHVLDARHFVAAG